MKSSNNEIYTQICSRKGQIAVLIDPEKTHLESQLIPLIEKSIFAKIDYFFVGGSTATRFELESTLEILKKNTTIPVVLFPGGANQISERADAILYLSLVSGRNPDFLITHHVNSAQELAHMNLEILPTGYLLVDGGTKSSVAYVSQTTPIPQDQNSIALNTSLAAIFQGKKILYFDAGSGAKESVPTQFITQLSPYTETPTIVGGGIRTIESIDRYKKAGVNVIVIGNHIEDNIHFLLDIEHYQRVAN